MAEKFTNNGQSTLSAGINNSVTSVTPVSASTFPTSGNFRIRIDDELMLVTAVAAGVFTVTRGIEGTAAASHSSGALIRHILTAGALAGEGGWTEVIKASDESKNTNTTIAADAELTFTPASGQLYEVELEVLYASPVGAGTPDLKWSAGEDGTARGVLQGISLSTTDAAQTVTVTSVSSGSNTCGTAAGKRILKIVGWVLGNAGTFAFRWAQNTSNANNVTVYAGSKLRYRAVP